MERVLPILFNTDMVRAILDGRKTVTRRLIKPQPKSKLCYTFAGSHKRDIGRWGYPSKTAHEFWGKEFKLPEDITEEELKKKWNPPYHTDDILYVRETWAPIYPNKESNEVCGYIYEEDSLEEYDNRYPDGKDYQWGGKWKPSIHMPNEAARIFLKVKDVRVEQLQEIPHDGALKEGIHFCECPDGFTWKPETDMHNCYITPMGAMQALWNSTIKKSDIYRYGWDANPWVWVIEFERCEKPENM